MDDFVFPLMLALDVQSLTMSLVNIASPRGQEGALADSIEAALRGLTHLDVHRTGDAVVARTNDGHGERVLVVGNLSVDPTESAHEPLAYVEMGKLYGPGASDAKGALATMLKAAAHGSFARDVTFAFVAGQPDEDVLAHAREADSVLLAAPTNSAVCGSVLEEPPTRRLIALTDRPAVSTDREALRSLDERGVAFGPGDPSLAGTAGEFVATADLGQCEVALRRWLTGEGPVS